MLEILGFLSQSLFVIATIFQTVKVYRDGHANGLSHALIWMLSIGFLIMIVYTVEYLHSDPIMLFGYIGQLLLFIYMAKMKYLPRNKSKNTQTLLATKTSRQDMNLQILNILKDYIYQYPDQRFGQILRNIGIVKTEISNKTSNTYFTNIFYEEPKQTLKRMVGEVFDESRVKK